MPNTTLTISPNEIDIKKTPISLKILVVLALMITIGGILTGIMTYMNVGLGKTFIANWLSSLAFAIICMIPIAIILMRFLTKIINKIMPNKSENVKNLMTGVSMSLIMESIISFITSVNNIGLSNISNFMISWLHALLAALPVGMAIVVITSMTVKPKIEKFLKS